MYVRMHSSENCNHKKQDYQYDSNNYLILFNLKVYSDLIISWIIWIWSERNLCWATSKALRGHGLTLSLFNLWLTSGLNCTVGSPLWSGLQLRERKYYKFSNGGKFKIFIFLEFRHNDCFIDRSDYGWMRRWKFLLHDSTICIFLLYFLWQIIPCVLSGMQFITDREDMLFQLNQH